MKTELKKFLEFSLSEEEMLKVRGGDGIEHDLLPPPPPPPDEPE